MANNIPKPARSTPAIKPTFKVFLWAMLWAFVVDLAFVGLLIATTDDIGFLRGANPGAAILLSMFVALLMASVVVLVGLVLTFLLRGWRNSIANAFGAAEIIRGTYAAVHTYIQSEMPAADALQVGGLLLAASLVDAVVLIIAVRWFERRLPRKRPSISETFR